MGLPQRRGRKFEKKIRHTIASGSLWFDKGDLTTDEEAIEVKYTDKKGFRLSLDHLEKIWSQALTSQKCPLLVLGIKRNERERFIVKCYLELMRK